MWIDLSYALCHTLSPPEPAIVFNNLTNENPFCLKAKISKILLLYRLRVGGGQPGQPFWPLFLKGQFELGHLQTDFLFFFPTHFWAIEFVWNSKEFHREREPLGRVSVEENSFFDGRMRCFFQVIVQNILQNKVVQYSGYIWIKKSGYFIIIINWHLIL